MSETTTQANHELLLGIGRDMNKVTHALQTICAQLLDLHRATSPALGLCGSHVAEWIDAGADPSAVIPAAQTVMVVQGSGPSRCACSTSGR